MTVPEALAEAVRRRASQHKLAHACGVSQPAISKAVKKGTCSPDLAIKIEAATGVQKHFLCPRVFTPPAPRATRKRSCPGAEVRA